MANVTENSQWESGIYRIETTDPVIGGENGIANVQAKQLANRTKYLKERADQVDAAKGGFGSLNERLNQISSDTQALGPDMQNMDQAVLAYALSMAGRAHDQVRAMSKSRIQEGEFTITNRGVVSGCTVSKSSTATRNLNLAAGTCFANGRVYSVASGNNVASVPQNTGASSVQVSAYLFLNNGAWSLACTAISGTVPDGAIEIYRLTIPANSTDATDPQLTSVTVTDVRRIEVGFPMSVDSPAYLYVPINWLPNANYQLRFDVVSAIGAPCEPKSISVANRAQNGFGIYLASAADSVKVRWQATLMSF